MPRLFWRIVFLKASLLGIRCHQRRLAIKNLQSARSLPAAAGNP
jgi:hypothetical protein